MNSESQIPITEEYLQVLGGTLRTLYRDRMTAKFKIRSYTISAKNFEIDKWVKIARLCVKAQVSPEDFMYVAFEYFANVAQGPFVSQLMTPKLVDACREYKNRHITPELVPTGILPMDAYVQDMLEFAAQQFMRKANTCSPFHPKVLDMLRFEYSGFTPLLRCLLCAGDSEVFRKYAAAAKAEIFNNIPLQHVLRSMDLPMQSILDYESK